MKNAKEHFGHELGPKTPEEYLNYNELAPQRPTFGDVNKSGSKNAGHDKSWSDATKKTSRQGDGNPGPITRISGGKNGDVVDPKDRSQYKYVAGGKKYSAEFGRVPDAGKKWEASAPTGDPTMYPNRGPQTPANLRPIEIGWKKRYAHALLPMPKSRMQRQHQTHRKGASSEKQKANKCPKRCPKRGEQFTETSRAAPIHVQ